MKIRFDKKGRMLRPSSDANAANNFSDKIWYDLPSGFQEGDICKLENDIPIIMTEIEKTTFEDDKLLSLKKEIKCRQIARQSKDYIQEGFIFEGVLFSLDPESKIHWLGIQMMIQSSSPGINSLISFPYTISGTDKDSGEPVIHTVNDADHYKSFFVVGMGAESWAVKSGTALEIQAVAATTQSELDTVNDTQAARDTIAGPRPGV